MITWLTLRIQILDATVLMKFMLSKLLEVNGSFIIQSQIGFNLFQFPFLEHENSVDALAANPSNEAVFATASHDRTIRIWDASRVKCLGILKGHEKGVWSCVYDNAGKRLLTASPDKSARIWDTKTGKQCGILNGHSLFVSIGDNLNCDTIYLVRNQS